MLIKISHEQALKLWKNNNIIMRNNTIGKTSEQVDCNNYIISQNKDLDFYIDLNCNQEKEAITMINKRMFKGIISSLLFLFGFMNLAIYTNSYLDKNLILCAILFISSVVFFQKAIDGKEINNFINNLN